VAKGMQDTKAGTCDFGDFWTSTYQLFESRSYI
jgi:hypothetical protein